MLRVTFGDVGDAGTAAGEIVVAATAWPDDFSKGEKVAAASASWGPVAFAIAAARRGSESTAVTFRMEALGLTVAETLIGYPAGSPRRRRRGSMTGGDPRTAT